MKKIVFNVLMTNDVEKLLIDPANKFIESKIKYFSAKHLNKKEKYFFTILDGLEIIALAHVHRIEKDLYIDYVSVSIPYEGKGLASYLIEEIHKWANLKNEKIFVSKFTDLGQILKNKFYEMKVKYPDVCQWNNLDDLKFNFIFDWEFTKQRLMGYQFYHKLPCGPFYSLQDMITESYKTLNPYQLEKLYEYIENNKIGRFYPIYRQQKKEEINICKF